MGCRGLFGGGFEGGGLGVTGRVCCFRVVVVIVVVRFPSLGGGRGRRHHGGVDRFDDCCKLWIAGD